MAKYVAAGLLLLASLTGCRMCANPYDDCYPVINSPSGPASGPVNDDYYGAATAPQSRNADQPRSTAGPHLARAE